MLSTTFPFERLQTVARRQVEKCQFDRSIEQLQFDDGTLPEAARQVPGVDIPDDLMGLDIGPKTVAAFEAVIAGAKTVIWNGPMGIFEKPPFDAGTVALAKAVAASGATSVVGGGDSEKAIKAAGVTNRISHVSTGGGASLEFLAGLTLPGVAALEQK